MHQALASRTDVGRIRSNNEDSFLVDAEAELYIVCDGMGGHNAGEVASKICCDTIHEEIGQALAQRDVFRQHGDIAALAAVREAVTEATQAACRQIWRQANEQREQAGMGTTCTLVLMVGPHKAVMAHVGDSRLYLLRGGRVVQLSEDHTYVGELVKRGALTAEQAHHHPQSNVLSRAMGVQESIAIDALAFDVDPDDTLLLCSDGIYNYYNEAREIGTLMAAPNLAQGLDMLINRALDRGGHDNCTGILWRPPAEPLASEALAGGNRAALLAALPPFASLADVELLTVLGCTQLWAVEAGTVVSQRGQHDDALIVVVDGELDLFAPGAQGRVLRRGDYAGLLALLGESDADITLRSRGTGYVMALKRHDFRALMLGAPILGAKLLTGLSTIFGADQPSLLSR